MLGTKRKLIAATSMLVVSAIMMTSASFAWFTISTNPEISGLETTMVTNGNLEIAMTSSITNNAYDEPTSAAAVGDANDYTTWGNLVDFSSIISADGGLVTELAPAVYTASSASSSTGTINFPTYGYDGRISDTDNSLKATAADTSADGFGYLVDNTTDNTQYGYYVDFWMRTNTDGALSLSTAVNRDGETTDLLGSGTTFTTTDKTLAKSVEIAFEVISGASTAAPTSLTVTPVVATPATAEDGDGNWVTTYSGSITDMTANTAYLVRMYVYLDGTDITNAMASTSVTGTLNVQFAHSETLDAMDATFAKDTTTNISGGS